MGTMRTNRTGGIGQAAGVVAVARTRVIPLLVLAALASGAGGCATLAPQERAILADPTMQFDAEGKHEAAFRHAIDNREGSMGGTGVAGGGCGCN